MNYDHIMKTGEQSLSPPPRGGQARSFVIKNFYNLIKSLYQIRLSVQEASFLETVEKSFEQRQLLTSNRLGKGNMNNIGTSHRLILK